MSELLSIFVDVLTPVFGMVAVGAVAGRSWSLDYRPLSTIAFRLLAPAFIFRLLSSPEGVDGPVAKMAAASLITVVAVWSISWLMSRRLALESRVLDALSSAFGNAGNLGFPIVLFALGDSALPSAGIHFLAVTVGVFVLGIVAAARLRSGSAAEAAVRVATTPAIAVTPFAVVLSATGSTLPLFATRFVDLLADAMIPVMLLTLGMQLAHAHLTRDAARLARTGFTRLVVSPVIYVAAASLLDLGGVARDSGLLIAAMPTAVLVGLISLEYELETEVATAAILATSLVSVPTLSVLLTLL